MRYKIYHAQPCTTIPYAEDKIQYVIGDAVKFEPAARSITMTDKFETVVHRRINVYGRVNKDKTFGGIIFSLWEITKYKP